MMEKYSVVSFDPRYLPDFVSLNRQWIEKYFMMEPMDLLQLQNPHESILNMGGEIFFILVQETVMGTVSVVPHGEDCYEIAKMAVREEARGRGYGDVLMETAIRWARSKGVKKLYLLSNTQLSPAISLYKKHGFKTVSLGEHPEYRRGNIEMELQLRGES